eukprot:CAMPEP_0197175298 /NCGR_PEP_ID=MMETSP1423-20130617/1562_1 /TAXON_ID=476441 /ORGANISM="Pseudo-nitzschia heimii, Strain UNC1101" /LENGTH=130 /DNA_ID=CAMNT_0042624419 /DNA_START=173 /DNA_END=562 /DNA_ORIENTATION=-
MKRNWIVGVLGSVWIVPAAPAATAEAGRSVPGIVANDDVSSSGGGGGKNLRGEGGHPVVVPNDRTTTIETFDVDLDLPPEDRWTEVMAKYGPAFRRVADWVIDEEIPKDVLPKLLAAFDLVEEVWPGREY